MKILMCGDRNYLDIEKIRKIFKILMELYTDIIIIEGAAPGADKLCGIVAKEFSLTLKEYPAQWLKYHKAAGPIRNKFMLDDNPDIELVVAFHNDIKNSKGTKDMIKQAKKRNIRIELIGDEK